MKSSSHTSDADVAQVLHYCLRLREAGIDAQGGILHYPKTRRTSRIAYTETEQARALADVAEAVTVLTRSQSPPRLDRSACRGCSYFDYCWSGA